MSSPRGKQPSICHRRGRCESRWRTTPKVPRTRARLQGPKGASWWCTQHSHPFCAPGLKGASPLLPAISSTWQTIPTKQKAALLAHLF